MSDLGLGFLIIALGITVVILLRKRRAQKGVQLLTTAGSEAQAITSMSESQRLVYLVSQRKNAGTYAVLAFFLGGLGGHRFYLGEIGRGLVIALLSLTGLGLLITVPWVIVDLCHSRQHVAAYNLQQAQTIAALGQTVGG